MTVTKVAPRFQGLLVSSLNQPYQPAQTFKYELLSPDYRLPDGSTLRSDEIILGGHLSGQESTFSLRASSPKLTEVTGRVNRGEPVTQNDLLLGLMHAFGKPFEGPVAGKMATEDKFDPTAGESGAMVPDFHPMEAGGAIDQATALFNIVRGSVLHHLAGGLKSGESPQIKPKQAQKGFEWVYSWD